MTNTPIITTNRRLLLELQAIRIGLELLIESLTGHVVSLDDLAKLHEKSELTNQEPLDESAITYERPQTLIDAEQFESEQTDSDYIAALGGFKNWKPKL